MPTLLIIGYVWPESRSSAAGSRMMQLIHFFLERETRVVFATTAVKTAFMDDLETLGIETCNIKLNSDSFDIFLQELRPELVLFDRFMMEEQFGWRVSENCPEAIKILDTEDLHFLRKAREMAIKQRQPHTPALLRSETAKREVASIYRCDLSLIISEEEMELLTNNFGVPSFLLCYLPLIVPVLPQEEELLPFEGRKHFLSIGNFRHEPNWDAVLQLKNRIWPLIRKQLPAAELHIYGAYPTQKVFELHSAKENFLIKGRAESATEVMASGRLLLAPIRFGAGIKGKFLDAMATGTPSITTTIGAEAMCGGLSWGGSIQDSEEEFAKAAVDLYTSKAQWQQARERALVILKERFSPEILRENLEKSLNPLESALPEHREKNFTGAMLQQHQLNSTRYLSKYIEAKNKLDHLQNKNAPD